MSWIEMDKVLKTYEIIKPFLKRATLLLNKDEQAELQQLINIYLNNKRG